MGYEEFVSFADWLPSSLATFGLILVSCAVLGAILAYLVGIVRYGPSEAFYKLWEGIFQAFPDLLFTSPKRVAAIARLAIQETLRRRVLLVVFALFALALLFGGWFLDAGSDHPERTYLGFVLGGTQFLVLFLGLLISTASLPQDIQNKTIYTVVTKPIRAGEIIMRRVLGFLLIGTVMIGSMGLISYFFVVGGLNHRHSVDVSEFVRVNPDSTDTSSGRRASANAYYEALSTRNARHRHRIELVLQQLSRGEGGSVGSGLQTAIFYLQVQNESGHTHDFRSVGCNQEMIAGGIKYTLFEEKIEQKSSGLLESLLNLFSESRYRVGLRMDVEEGIFENPEAMLAQRPLNEVLQDMNVTLVTSNPQEMLQARVPYYARELSYLDREGNITEERGMSVGKMNEKYGYIDGGTSLARAIYRFNGLRPGMFSDDRVAIDMNLRVFRTLKGDIIHRVTGSVYFRVTKEEDGRKITYETEPVVFESQEYSVQTLELSRNVVALWTDVEGNPARQEMDLLTEFADNGKFEVVLRCNEAGMYFGVAPSSVYFKLRDGSFALNFAKCFFGIWLQFMLISSLGVTLSSFLNASVSLLATVVALLIGFFGDFIRDVATQQIEGGGPLEATYRLITQMNVTSELEGTIRFVSYIDVLLVKLMEVMTYIIPDFTQMHTQGPLADGYNIPVGLVGFHTMVAFAFAMVLCIVGYFSLKTREIAA